MQQLLHRPRIIGGKQDAGTEARGRTGVRTGQKQSVLIRDRSARIAEMKQKEAVRRGEGGQPAPEREGEQNEAGKDHPAVKAAPSV